MMFAFDGENTSACWSGWMLFLPWLLMFFHCHVERVRVPRQASIAPRYTFFASVGDAATYQSYHAWATSTAGAGIEVILVHVVPERRHRCAVWPAAPKA